MAKPPLKKQPAPSPAPPPGDALKARIILGVIAIGLVTIFISRCSGPSHKEPATYTFRAAAQELVKQRLGDPSSAEFTDINVMEGAPGRSTIVCGRVNARNGFGGMTGAKRFVVGSTVALEADVGTADMDQLWARFC
jgi:hypothetical protein